MPQYRKDPLSGRWVIIAEERAGRPMLMSPSAEDCPFCPGHESETPDEIDAFRPKHSTNISDWTVRVVPNLYPAVARHSHFPHHRSFRAKYGRMLDLDDPLDERHDPEVAALPGVGAHEVIVDTPRHISCISEMTDDECREMLRMYRRRLREIRHNESWAHVLLFKNVGEAAGATVHHSHSQLISMPFVPPPIQRELFRAIEFRCQTELCYWCAHIESERKLGVRIIEETKRFVLLCPYLSRFPAEMTIFPKRHISHFETLDDMALTELSKLLRRVVFLMKHALTDYGPLEYNLVVKSGPFFSPGPPDAVSTSDTCIWFRTLDYAFENAYHLHINIFPCLTRAAGFEWGSGLHINPIAPETAAEKFRKAAQERGA